MIHSIATPDRSQDAEPMLHRYWSPTRRLAALLLLLVVLTGCQSQAGASYAGGDTRITIQDGPPRLKPTTWTFSGLRASVATICNASHTQPYRWLLVRGTLSLAQPIKAAIDQALSAGAPLANAEIVIQTAPIAVGQCTQVMLPAQKGSYTYFTDQPGVLHDGDYGTIIVQ